MLAVVHPGIRVLMSVTVAMRVGVGVGVTVIVTVPLCRIGAGLGLERQGVLAHDQVHGAQHVCQYVVGFDLQMVRLEFDRHVAVAQVVGGANQIERRAVLRAMTDVQHRLRRGDNAHQRAVFGHQHVAAAHHVAARQENAQRAA